MLKQTIKDIFLTPEPAERVQLVLMVLMQFAFIGVIVFALVERAWLTLFVAVIALLAVWVLPVLAHNYRVHVPLEFVFLLNVFMYGSLFLGEIQGYYSRFWWWDMVLHAGSGMALGFIGFLIMYSLYREGRLAGSSGIMALFSFCFALALGTVWEIFEFTLDSFFGFNMQKSGLVDTMHDLIVDAVAASVAALSGYVYMKYNRTGVGLFRYLLNLYFKQKHARLPRRGLDV